MLQASGIVSRDNENQKPAQTQQSAKHGISDVNVGRVERWSSFFTGAALAFYGLKRRSVGGIVLSAAGASLIYRGLTGRCPLYGKLGVNTADDAEAAEPSIHVEKTITILTSPEQLYRFWRRFDNLPCFMWHVESVQTTGDGRSHWKVKGPLGTTFEWDAEITEDRENELIAWRSLEGNPTPNDGCVRFHRIPGGRGTELHIMLNYYVPLGKLGATIAKVLGKEPGQQIEEDLRRLKRLMEAGEIPTTEGQPSGRISMTDVKSLRRRQHR
jgi:uncharacterized membrane protein